MGDSPVLPASEVVAQGVKFVSDKAVCVRQGTCHLEERVLARVDVGVFLIFSYSFFWTGPCVFDC